MQIKYTCKDCHAKLQDGDLLSAPNPFEPAESNIWGCPKCKGVDCFTRACEEEDCWQDATCGTPYTGGYKWSCYKHKPASEA